MGKLPKFYITSPLNPNYGLVNDDDCIFHFPLLKKDKLDVIENINKYNFSLSSPDDFRKHSDYINRKHSFYIKILSQRFNRIHGVNYDHTFWERLLSLGLLRYITYLHQINQIFIKNYKSNDSKLELNLMDENSFNYFETFDELRNQVSGSWFGVEQIFSIYVRNSKIPKNKFKYFNYKNKKIGFYKTLKFIKATIRTFIINIKVLTKYPRKEFAKILLIGCYFGKNYKEKICRNTNNKIVEISLPPVLSINKINIKNRKFISCVPKNSDEFDKIFFSSLEYMLPKVYLENFKINFSYYEKISSIFTNNKVIVSEAWMSSTHINIFRNVSKLKKNVKTFYNEHNAIIHPFEGRMLEDIAQLCDKYLTFGWSKKDLKYQSTSSLFPFKWNSDLPRKYDILYVGYTCEPFLHSYQPLYEFADVCGVRKLCFVKQFFELLPQSFKKKIYMRSYPVDYNIDYLTFDRNMILENFIIGINHVSSLKFRGESCKFQMKSSKIVVCEGLSTAYIESLKMNIPTLVFIDLEYKKLRTCYEGYFDDLINAKIVHTSPSSAVNHLQNIYTNPNQWWQSETVQDLKNNWLNRNFGETENMINYLLGLAKI